MPARSVQISLDSELLREVDGRAETQREGRSAVIARALRLYLEANRRREVDAAYARAYGGAGGQEMLDEIGELLGAQAWPDE